MALPVNQKTSGQSLISSIVHLPQSFLIWWTGAKRKDLPNHLRNSYAGLGAMAMVSTTLATYGGYSFVLISIGSTLGAVPGAILAGYFMWGMDRSVLGSPGKDSLARTSRKSDNSSKKGMWVKLAVNVAFSSILTLPLSVYIQRGAVQKHNMNLTTAQIERLEGKIDKQNSKIVSLEEIKAEIDANWRQGSHANGKRNEAYFQDKEQARQDVNEAKAEKSALEDEKEELKQEYKAYERGDFSKVSLSFPEQFYHMMSQARWTDNLLNFSFFTITALMSSGAVLIKTFVFGNDSYTKKLQALEDRAIHEEELKNALNISAQQVYYSLFNTDGKSDQPNGMASPRLKTKLQRLQREFESETERMATWLYDERTKQMQQKVREQAVSEDIKVSLNDHELGSNNNIADGLGQGDRSRGNSAQVSQASNKSNKPPSPKKKPKTSKSFLSKINHPWKKKSSRKNEQQVGQKEDTSPKIAKNENFMTLFGDVDRQISQEKETLTKNNGNSNSKNHHLL